VQEQLLRAKMDGLVRWRLEVTDVGDGHHDYEVWYRRQDLIDYAELIGEEPEFLFRNTRSDSEQSHHIATAPAQQSSIEPPEERQSHETLKEEAKYESGLLTVKQLCEQYPEFSEGSLRYHIWRSRPQRDGKTGTMLTENGLAPAVKRKGRAVRIDVRQFMEWWTAQTASQDVANAGALREG
jgi:hypothetical protein